MELQRPSSNASSVAVDGCQSKTSDSHSLRPEFAKLNRDFPWDDFDSRWYYDHNYKVLRDDDRQILEAVRDFFVKTCPTSRESHGHGLDVGSGTNLYPALAMLPFCDRITLCEYSAMNVSWLEDEIKNNSPSWDSFWKLLAKKSSI